MVRKAVEKQILPLPPGEGRVRENRSPWDSQCWFEPDLHDCGVRLRRTFTLTPAPLPEGSPLVTSGLQGIESSHDSGNFLQAACESHATGRSAGRFASIAAYLGQP